VTLLAVAGEVDGPASILAVAMPRGTSEYKIMPALRGLVNGEFYQAPCVAVKLGLTILNKIWICATCPPL